MNTTQSKLTAGERRYLEHLRQAQARGLKLAEYCRARGLNAQTLYNISSRLARKATGPLRSGAVVARRPDAASQFVAVQIAPAASGNSGVPCRLRHPSGWTIECADLPQASWMAALVQGGNHAST
jgi:hypothetical protein